MRVIKLMVAVLMIATIARADLLPWHSYAEAQGGISVLNDNTHDGSAAGFRIGVTNDRHEIGVSYDRTDAEIDGSRLLPGYLTMQTVSLDLRRIYGLGHKTRITLGLMGGLAVPNPDTRFSETIDPGFSGTAVGALTYKITDSWTAGVNVKYFAFHADSHRTTYLIECTALMQDGVQIGSIETSTPQYSDNSISFNNVQATVGVNYKFQ